MGETANPMMGIPAGEYGVVRVFDLDMSPEQVRFLREPGALAQQLGLETLDLNHVEMFHVTDLEELGLRGYLIEGCGIAEDSLAPFSDTLEALDGSVLLLRSRAFLGQAAQLSPAPKLHFVGAFSEPASSWSATPVTAESARPKAARVPPRVARAKSRQIGLSIFVVVMSLVVLALVLLVT